MTTKKDEIIEGEVVENEVMEVGEQLSKSDIVLPVNIEGMKEAWKRFLEVKKSLLTSDRVKYNKYGHIAKANEEGKDYIIKSGWRKVATAFNLSIDQNRSTPQKIWGEDGEGKYYTWLFSIRIIAPNGRYVDSIGVCSSRKPFFSKKGDTRIDPSEEDIVLMAQTVGINRGISDMVGGGEVSGEEMIGKEQSTDKTKQISTNDNLPKLDPTKFKVPFRKSKYVGMVLTDCPQWWLEGQLKYAEDGKFIPSKYGYDDEEYKNMFRKAIEIKDEEQVDKEFTESEQSKLKV